MSTRLVIRSGRASPARPKGLADGISNVIDNLCMLGQLAADDARGQARTEQLLDQLALQGEILTALARGRRLPA